MAKRLSLVGQKFGKLIVLEFSRMTKNCSYWACLCDCGNKKIIQGRHLITGNTSSCGCLAIEQARINGRTRILSLEGQKFGQLSVINLNKTFKGESYWFCVCKCGSKRIVRGSSLVSGATKSCGCFRLENPPRKTHGMTYSPTWNSWQSMHIRCSAKDGKMFKVYGSRGITICKRWFKFENFLADMGERPIGKTIHRLDNNKGYYKKNCVWADWLQQARNRTNNVYLTFNGQTKCVAEWSETLNINAYTLYDRIDRGWSVTDTLTIPVAKK